MPCKLALKGGIRRVQIPMDLPACLFCHTNFIVLNYVKRRQNNTINFVVKLTAVFNVVFFPQFADNSVTSLISHDRGGEWKLIPLTEKQCKGVSLKVNI